VGKFDFSFFEKLSKDGSKTNNEETKMEQRVRGGSEDLGESRKEKLKEDDKIK
jgi:hypothetical protein